MSDPAIQRIGRYEIRGELGHGAMGVVYRACDTVLDRVVALKTHHVALSASEEVRRRFAAEVKTSSRLNHPNIVTVYDGGIDTDVPFIAMELVDGTTLESMLEEQGKLAPKEALAILAPVGEALAYAHRQHVIHRDLKPANILVTAGGQPKVMDFGVAKALDTGGPATTMLVGTPSHMAPEQISGGKIDARVDVFALGVVTYEVLTGRKPFGGDNLPQIAHSILTSEPPPPSQLVPILPKAMDAVVAKALAKDPAARYVDTDAFVHDLGDVLDRSRAEAVAFASGATVALPPADPSPVALSPAKTNRAPAAAETGRRRGAPLSLGAGLAVAAAAAGFFLLRPASEMPTPVSNGTKPPAIAEQPVIPEPAAVASVPEQPAARVIPEAPAQPLSGEAPSPPAAVGAPAPPAADLDAKAAPASEAASPPRVAARRKADTEAPPEPIPAPVRERKPAHAVPREPEPETAALPPSRGLEDGPSKESSLTVESEPPGASVRVNGAPRGAAPVLIGDLAGGSYDVTVEFAGVPPQSRTVQVNGGGSHHTITFRLSAH